MKTQLTALFAAVAIATSPLAEAGKPCSCSHGGKPSAPSPHPSPAPSPKPPSPSAPSPAPSPAPTPAPTPSPAPSPSPSPAPAPAPSPGPSPSPSPAPSPAPSQAATGSGFSSSGTWKPWLDPQYQAWLAARREVREDALSPDPVMPPAVEIPAPTPQPETSIVYIPYAVEVIVERIVEVPVYIEKTVNVCPVVPAKPKPKHRPFPGRPTPPVGGCK